MTLRLDQQVIRNPQGRIKYRRFHPTGREHYHLGLWLEGPDDVLDRVDAVEYRLHPTFRTPLRRSKNRPNKFSITFWTWGMFEVEATVHFEDGATEALSHFLQYELPADTGETYVDVSS